MTGNNLEQAWGIEPFVPATESIIGDIFKGIVKAIKWFVDTLRKIVVGIGRFIFRSRNRNKVELKDSNEPFDVNTVKGSGATTVLKKQAEEVIDVTKASNKKDNAAPKTGSNTNSSTSPSSGSDTRPSASSSSSSSGSDKKSSTPKEPTSGSNFDPAVNEQVMNDIIAANNKMQKEAVDELKKSSKDELGDYDFAVITLRSSGYYSKVAKLCRMATDPFTRGVDFKALIKELDTIVDNFHKDNPELNRRALRDIDSGHKHDITNIEKVYTATIKAHKDAKANKKDGDVKPGGSDALNEFRKFMESSGYADTVVKLRKGIVDGSLTSAEFNKGISDLNTFINDGIKIIKDSDPKESADVRKKHVQAAKVLYALFEELLDARKNESVVKSDMDALLNRITVSELSEYFKGVVGPRQNKYINEVINWLGQVERYMSKNDKLLLRNNVLDTIEPFDPADFNDWYKKGGSGSANAVYGKLVQSNSNTLQHVLDALTKDLDKRNSKIVIDGIENIAKRVEREVNKKIEAIRKGDDNGDSSEINAKIKTTLSKIVNDLTKISQLSVRISKALAVSNEAGEEIMRRIGSIFAS